MKNEIDNEIENEKDKGNTCTNCEQRYCYFKCKYCKKSICYECVIDKSCIIIKSNQINKSCYECYDEYVEEYKTLHNTEDEEKIEERLNYIDKYLSLPNEVLQGLHDGWLIRCDFCQNIWNGKEKCLCNLSEKINTFKFDEETNKKSEQYSMDPNEQMEFLNPNKVFEDFNYILNEDEDDFIEYNDISDSSDDEKLSHDLNELEDVFKMHELNNENNS